MVLFVSKLLPEDATRALLAFLVVLIMPLGAKVSSAAGSSSPSAGSPGATFKPVAFSALPGWEADDHAAAFGAFRKSCARIIAAARAGNKAGKIAIPSELLAVCADAARLPDTVDRAAAKTFFEARFQPHTVVHKGSSGLLTGYYEPLLEGSRKADARFKTPIYKRPPDLVNLVEEAQRGAKGAVLTHARRTDKGNIPYATRAEIDGGALAGKSLELLYLVDAVDLFFMQVQGSGRIQLPDGSKIRVHYDGKNGHPYTSIGRYLIDKGLLAADKLSLAALQKWLRADPQRAAQVMHQNASYVFFRELKGAEAEHVLGVLEIPLTPGRSLAVDAGVHALGTPVYVSAPKLTHATQGHPFQRLMIAQDVGSAIKGPERGDIYFGSGHAAAALAGVTKHPGRFHVLLPRAAGGDADPAKPAARARQAKQQ
jgi:membrane-bound lytic murein transglycosylase A